MSDSVKLKDLFLGISDGAVEAKEENFQELFFDPNNKYEELMSSNEKFLILGNKGTGKTYLANYVLKKAMPYQKVKMMDANDFIICKLSNLSRENLEDETAYALCKWFFLDQIAHMLLESHKIKAKYIPFSKLYKLKEFVKKYENDDFFKEIKRINSNSKSIQVSNNYNHGLKLEKYKSASASGFNNSQSNGISFEAERKDFFEMIPAYEELLFNAIKKNDDIMLIIDDIDELGNLKSENGRGNIIVNLIRVAKEYNLKSKKGKAKIVLLIRSDILDELQIRYANLSKIKTSCSVELYWLYDSVNEQYEHPLMSMVLHKIKASCPEYSSYTNKKLFNELFPENIDSKRPLDYLLDHGFGRPRDFVTFLNHAKNLFQDSTYFSGTILKETRKPYSSDFYNELLNQASYYGNPEYVKQCLHLLASVKKPSFFYSDIHDQYINNESRYTEISHLDDALIFLYKIGAIGNVWKTGKKGVHTCWSYKKDAMDDIDLSKKFTIHYALRKKFSL